MTTESNSPGTALTSETLDTDTTARIALALAGVSGDPGVSVALSAFGGAAAFVAAVHDWEDGAAPLAPTVRNRIRGLATAARVAEALDRSRRMGLSFVTPLRGAWPLQLESLRGIAPVVLWTRGETESLTAPSVAVTGTTDPSAFGVHMGIELATGLASRGWAIAAGAGPGIDDLSRRSAVAMHGRGVTVAGASLERTPEPQPGEVVVSEVPPGCPATVRSQRRAKFLVAAISAKTIVVEAGVSSGALRTAEAAYAMSRPVGVVVGADDDPRSAGCRAFASQHDVEVVASIRDADRLH